MKTPTIVTVLALLGSLTSVSAQLTIPAADGSDGTPAISGATYNIDLSQAIPGDAITSSNSGGNVGKGIYDSARRIIVFKYASVTVPAGTTVTFTNHPSRAPVAWIVQGNVTINGTVSVNGRNGAAGTTVDPTEPGPGGFRGGAVAPQGVGVGLGPSGGAGDSAFAAAFNTSYGNPQLIPLIGGSGGAGWSGGGGSAGGSAGGAILIATRTTIAMAAGSSITALGGTSALHSGISGGSGGGIRLVADQITGTGTVTAGSSGRVRIEANVLSPTIATTPSTITVPPGTGVPPMGGTPTLVQSLTSPTVKIVSVDGVASPADPTAPLVSSADIAIQKNTPVTIVLETRNFATAGAVVAVRIAYKYGSATTVNATLQGGGTTALSTWTLSTTLAPGFVTLQARATQP